MTIEYIQSAPIESIQSIAVGVIILNWNNWQSTSLCIESLIKSKEKNINLIVVDNASEDDSVTNLKAVYPELVYIQNEENYGFARGCNVGIDYALRKGARHILLVNNDAVVGEKFLTNAINLLDKNEDVFAVTGKILMGTSSELIWQAGGRIDMFRIQGVSRGYGEKDTNQYDESCETEWASGAFSLFPSRTFTKIGLLPEEYFFGQEEWDFSQNIIRKGKKIIYLPSFKCVHAGGASYRKNHPILLVYGYYLNKNIFAKKYLSPLRYKIWRVMFKFYILFIWPVKARHYVCDRYMLNDYKQAAKAALNDFDHVTHVTKSILFEASKKLKISSSWRS
jgi:GT2 family glycosyltransferase